MPNDLKYHIALTTFPKFGPVRIKKLRKNFPDLKNAFKAGLPELMRAGIDENIANEFISTRKNIVPDKILEQLEIEKIKTVCIEDSLYPELLKEIFDPPQLLYYKGTLAENDVFTIAVVGTRKFTSYGQRATEKIVRVLAKNKLTIVSGLALGIDALAHYATLEAGGRTIGILGSGLDRQNIYPTQNRALADKIILNNGALISEFPLGMPPLKHNFPQRNRLVSGMSRGALVIEAAEKSGALITANFALDQNREVFAVPGNIYSSVSLGTNKLIKQGAHVVTCAEDVMEALKLNNINTFVETKKTIPETKEEIMIIEYIKNEAKHINELVRLTGLDTSRINSTLAIMEMKGMVHDMGNGLYVKK